MRRLKSGGTSYGRAQMTEDEERIESVALAYARANKKAIAKLATDPNLYPGEEEPVSVFMAGSPGAGKTEASIELLAALGTSAIRIDADELRTRCPGYEGGNAWLYQKAASVLVEKVHDLALEQNQSFILDATFSNYERAKHNIVRSLKKKRIVQILYVYQEPRLAWQFVQDREKAEGRRVLPEKFVDQYFQAREVVNRVKTEFGGALKVDLLLKNVDNSNRQTFFGVERIDPYIPEKYSREEVERIAKGG
jgi:UDP-N-acetylglucosamine kinase